MVAAIAMPVYAADPVDLAGLAEDIRKGKLDVGTEYSLDVGTGRFHNIHANALGLGCATCHAGTEYQSDFLLLRKYEEVAESSPGRPDRSSCLGCHQTGGTATTWYSGRATK
jgi:hypothetical protein